MTMADKREASCANLAKNFASSQIFRLWIVLLCLTVVACRGNTTYSSQDILRSTSSKYGGGPLVAESLMVSGGSGGGSEVNHAISARLRGIEADQSPGARFLSRNGTVVTAQRGSTASLPCEVLSLGDGVVTWFRRKDFHLLTVGHAVYSSDERFFVQGPPRSTQTQDWALQIRFLQERDAGLYECQLSTHPPSSLFIELVVVEARAEIEGGPEKYVKSGSTLKLTCNIRDNSVVPDFVFWYHDGRMINYEGSRGVVVTGDKDSSTLTIGRAQSFHSGNYSCVPSNVRPASVIVHILNGEKPAAMQHSSSGKQQPLKQQLAIAVVSSLVLRLLVS